MLHLGWLINVNISINNATHRNKQNVKPEYTTLDKRVCQMMNQFLLRQKKYALDTDRLGYAILCNQAPYNGQDARLHLRGSTKNLLLKK